MRLLKTFIPWMISAALCVLAVELLGAGVAWWTTKSLVYLNAPKPVVVEAPPALLGEACVRAYLQLKARARL